MPNISSTWTNPQSATLDLAGYVAGGYAGDIVKASWWSAFVSNEQYLFDRIIGDFTRVQCSAVTRFTGDSNVSIPFVNASITIAKNALVLFHIDEQINGSSGFSGYWGARARFFVNEVFRQEQRPVPTSSNQLATVSFWYAGVFGPGTYTLRGEVGLGDGTDVGTVYSTGFGSALIAAIYTDH